MSPPPDYWLTSSRTALCALWYPYSPPLGLNFGPACEKCCHYNNIDATTLFGTDMWGIPDNSPWHPVAGKLRGNFSVSDSWPNRDTSLPPCVACGIGDNTTQHWARFCIIPVLVATALASPPQHVRSLDQVARSNVAGCVIASHVLHQFRRLLLEHGGMQHSTSSVTLSITEWLARLHDNCLQATPTRFLNEQPSPICPRSVGSTDNDHPCHMQITNNEAVTLQSVALPDVVCTATAVLGPEQPVATLPLGHPWLKLISPTNAHRAGLQANVRIEPAGNEPQPSSCQIIAIRPIGVDQMILADPPIEDRTKPLYKSSDSLTEVVIEQSYILSKGAHQEFLPVVQLHFPSAPIMSNQKS